MDKFTTLLQNIAIMGLLIILFWFRNDKKPKAKYRDMRRCRFWTEGHKKTKEELDKELDEISKGKMPVSSISFVQREGFFEMWLEQEVRELEPMLPGSEYNVGFYRNTKTWFGLCIEASTGSVFRVKPESITFIID